MRNPAEEQSEPEPIDVKPFGVDAFVRSIVVNRDRAICFLFGAGTSLTSGMPSAERCIWDWKRDIFVSNNPTLREAVGELTLAGTRKRIQCWLDQQGRFPVSGHESEYSFYADACYPAVGDRKSFFYSYVKKAVPHTGYKLIPLLVRSKLIRTIWTTNFDSLPSRACAGANVVCVEVGMDSAERVLRPPVSGELRVVSMHGDYRYDALKNTTTELQEQEGIFKRELGIELKDCDLVVLGYSGRDSSIMDVLRDVYSAPGQTRLFWCGFGEDIPSEVRNLIGDAKQAGREAFYVPTEGFDDVMTRLTLSVLEPSQLSEARKLIEAHSESQAPGKLFTTPPVDPTTLFKSNAYPLTYPREVFQVALNYPKDMPRRQWLKQKLAAIDACGVATGDGAFLLGDATELRSAFQGFMSGPMTAHAVSSEDFAKDRRIRSVMRKGLALALRTYLGTNGSSERIWEKDHYEIRKYLGQSYKVHRALKADLTNLSGQPLAILTPEVMIYNIAGQLVVPEIAKILQNEVYGYQHNHVFGGDLNYWVNKFGNTEVPAWSLGAYKIQKAPWFAGITEPGKAKLRSTSSYVKQSGVVVNDTPLLFASRNGHAEVKDVHPIHGLVTNRPWDYALTANGLAPQVELAVICPLQDASNFSRFLIKLQERIDPPSNEQEYLLPYPGFSNAFSLPLNVPTVNEPKWQTVIDKVGGGTMTAAKELAQRLCRGLDSIRGTNGPGAVVLIYVPTRWKDLKVVEAGGERFNLHDYVKAYAARAGLSTQFIREETTQSQQACRVRWWLSLALYAKALRTPWRLHCIDDETAYVGIGYSIDQEAENGSHILLGCSHLYSSRGEGLQFRLGRLESSIIKGGNPFMSEDDARRTGETIRQLFFEAKMRLPSRVVVHKRTHFTKDEQRGLCQGLEGVGNIELIEINIDDSLRYLSSKKTANGFDIDRFPVPRGTTIVLGGHSALVWVHGSAPNVSNPQWRYYQGKRRIPAPLAIKRYMGQSDVMQVASEILGLSKMNWNHFDYYSQIPATLASANAIARVGPYLSAFGPAAYDYRLLI